MHPIKKTILKALSYPYLNLKKYYKIYRKLLNAINPSFKPLYNLMDHKVMVGDREIQVRLFQPKKQKSNNVLIFFHGGGWVTGNIDSYTNVCSNMANQTGHKVISVNYRLAPEHPFPAGVEDCYHVTRDIFLNLDILKCKQTDITLIGDSAGGNLAAAVSLMARDRGEFLPTKQILLYPSTYYDHSDTSPFNSIRDNGTDYLLTSKRIQDYWDLYISNDEDRFSPYAAPLLAENLFNQPKTLIITAEYDPLRDEGEAYGMRLREYHNEVKIYRMEDALHGFISLPWDSEHVIKCYNIINQFLNEEIIESGCRDEI
ncbi:alpha/beta hydrolase [Dehalobacterium formicoaceticum]|uniref:alpha/beta hydrolase n=1 Tax=Dehalobacterium formicoaceticum TaxID=51515 RepID=UPI000B7DB1F8|nr:alpha/beta hydrolase [Dehalobacterium formicoaceticum]